MVLGTPAEYKQAGEVESDTYLRDLSVSQMLFQPRQSPIDNHYSRGKKAVHPQS